MMGQQQRTAVTGTRVVTAGSTAAHHTPGAQGMTGMARTLTGEKAAAGTCLDLARKAKAVSLTATSTGVRDTDQGR